MNINTQQTTQQQPIPTDTPKNTAFEPHDKKQETLQPSDVTVNLSSAAVEISSSTKKPPSSSTINNQEQAEEAVKQFQQQAANEPVLTQEVQSNDLTSELVAKLTG